MHTGESSDSVNAIIKRFSELFGSIAPEKGSYKAGPTVGKRVYNKMQVRATRQSPCGDHFNRSASCYSWYVRHHKATTKPEIVVVSLIN